MIKISVVGDIGSGKTYISKLFRAPYFSADDEVTKLYRKNRKCFKKLKNKFPNFIISFPINKKELMELINRDFFNIKNIGAIVHPFVRKEFNKFLKINKKKQIVILDIPLYLENKMNKKEDVIIFLKTKRSDVNKRLKERKNLNSKILNMLRSSQFPLKRKKNYSHYVLVNNFNRLLMKKRVKILKAKILNDRSSS